MSRYRIHTIIKASTGAAPTVVGNEYIGFVDQTALNSSQPDAAGYSDALNWKLGPSDNVGFGDTINLNTSQPDAAGFSDAVNIVSSTVQVTDAAGYSDTLNLNTSQPDTVGFADAVNIVSSTVQVADALGFGDAINLNTSQADSAGFSDALNLNTSQSDNAGYSDAINLNTSQPESAGFSDAVNIVSSTVQVTDSVGYSDTLNLNTSQSDAVGFGDAVNIVSSTVQITDSPGFSDAINLNTSQPDTVGFSDAINLNTSQADSIGFSDTITLNTSQPDNLGFSDGLITLNTSQADAIGFSDVSPWRAQETAQARSGTPDADAWGDAWVDFTPLSTNTNHGATSRLSVGQSATFTQEALMEIDYTRIRSFVNDVPDGVSTFTFTALWPNVVATPIGTIIVDMKTTTSRPFIESTVTAANAPAFFASAPFFKRNFAFNMDGATRTHTITWTSGEVDNFLSSSVFLVMSFNTSLGNAGTFQVMPRESSAPPSYDYRMIRS